MKSSIGNVLIIFAHPAKYSTNSRLRDKIIDNIKELNGNVTVSDLYKMNFNPVAGVSDFAHEVGFNSGKSFRTLQQRSLETGNFVNSIVTEQEKVSSANHVIFQFPMWLFGMPAILKGWFDRILTKGFAYGKNMEYEQGGMKGKSAGVVMTTAGSKNDYSTSGMHGELDILLHPITQTMLPYLGFGTWEPVVLHGVEALDSRELDELIEMKAKEVVRNLITSSGQRNLW